MCRRIEGSCFSPAVINLYTNKCVRVIGKVRRTEYLYPSLVPRLMWEGRVEIASYPGSCGKEG